MIKTSSHPFFTSSQPVCYICPFNYFSFCCFAIACGHDGAPLPSQSSLFTSRFLPILHLFSCLPLVSQPSCQISWANARCLDSLVRVLLRCDQARSLYLEDCRVACALRFASLAFSVICIDLALANATLEAPSSESVLMSCISMTLSQTPPGG